MSALVSTLSAGWTRLSELLARLAAIPERVPRDYAFVASDVAQLHRLCTDPGGPSIDDATWKDLLLGDYCARLSDQTSIFGQHVLYQRLRAGLDDDACADQAARVRTLIQDPARLDALHQACKPLREADKEIATLLYQDAPPPVAWWAGKTWPLPILLLASIGAVIVSPFAWLLTLALCYFLMSNQMRYHDRVEEWQRSMHALQMLLKVGSTLGARGEPTVAESGRINRALSRSPVLALIPGARAYADWFMLDNVNHYFKAIVVVHGNLDYLRGCFQRIAVLEADIALARHLAAAGPAVCWAERRHGRALELKQMVHPLLPQAQPLSLALEGKGAFISGQNGIGKSTLLRTIGLNLVTARAFGFCHAARARVPALPVYSSMQSEDSMFGGESLYMAELRRAKELLAAADGPHPGIYLIDEIFRGTNHLESVSAAASVLDVLAAKGLVVVSSHNLVLAALLEHRLAPKCVRLDAGGRLLLGDGVLAHTNGIALLAKQGFGAQIEGKAGRVFAWLDGYLAHPAGSGGVLAEVETSPKS